MLQCKTKWKRKKLDSICNYITTGKLDANAMVEGGEYRFYTCAENHYKIDTYAFEGQSLLISGNGANVGYIHYYNGKFNAYQRTYVLQNFDENIFYIKHYLKAYLKDRIAKEVNAGNIPFIKLNTLTDMNIQYPESKDEQQKIADILSTCDEVIEKTEETIEKYKQIKAGLMQNLFTRGLDENGTLRPTYTQAPDLYKYSKELDRHIPKEWDAKRLDGIATILSGKDYKGNPKGNYNIPIYGTGGIMGYTTIPLYSGPAILTGRKGSINTPYYVEGNFWNVDTIFCLKMLEDNDALWFYYQIYITDMTKYNEATGVPSTTTKTLNKILFAVPKPPEQMKIAESIIKFDKKIKVEEKYLNKYKQIKQGLMKRLLTPPADAEIVEE